MKAGLHYFDHIPISGSEVHVWWMLVPAVSLQTLAPLLDMLDPEEQMTYLRYKVDSKKIEFLSGHSLAKTLLSAYIGTPPSGVRFSKNSYGKPFLANVNRVLYFNISHSDSLIVCAISSNKEIGIDVEKADKERYDVMHLVFSQEEIEWVDSQPDEFAKLDAFYTLWTRKEAVMKAVGKGFALPPSSFTVPVNRHFTQNDDFDFYTFELPPRYVTTVATRRIKDAHIHYKIREVKFPQLLDDIG